MRYKLCNFGIRWSKVEVTLLEAEFAYSAVS